MRGGPSGGGQGNVGFFVQRRRLFIDEELPPDTGIGSHDEDDEDEDYDDDEDEEEEPEWIVGPAGFRP